MNEYSALTHFYNVGVAFEYSLNEAVILQNIFFWVKKNEANGTHYHDGRYWTYNSAAAFTKLFPYFTERQVRYTLKKLEENGLILVGNYNKNPIDNTKWYALTDKAYEMYGQVAPQVTESSVGDLQSCQSGVTNSSVGDLQIRQSGVTELSVVPDTIVRPIPDRNTDRERSDTNSDITPDDSSVCGGDVAVGEGTPKRTRPTRDEVRRFVTEKRLHVDADRFFDVNEQRGWTTKEGKPVDDWKGYALVWERYESQRPPETKESSYLSTPYTDNPSIEWVMENFLCDRETAEELIREHIV